MQPRRSFRTRKTPNSSMFLSTGSTKPENDVGGSSSASTSSPESKRIEAPQENSISLDAWLQHDHESFHFFSKSEAVQIRTRLLDWYYQNRRKLPWRGDPPPWNGSTAGIGTTAGSTAKSKGMKAEPTKKRGKQPTLDAFFVAKTAPNPRRTPTPSSAMEAEPTSSDSSAAATAAFPVTGYGVWVSEIMLQQTRVDAVIPYWVKWMEAFPTVQALAQATPEQVNAQWAGLGFYRRARLLHQAAKQVVEQYQGQVPITEDELLKLPGIGRYTANAIASIAFDRNVPVVDGNVCRVLSRLRAIAQSVKAPALKDKWGWVVAEQLLDIPSAAEASERDNELSVKREFKAGDVNQALMELGATYCAPSGSGLDPNDPLRDFYWSTQLGHQVKLVSDKSKLYDRVSLHGKTCPICAVSGVVQVLDSMNAQMDAIDGDTSVTQAKVCGHQAFPVAPDKLSKREEVLAVAVISLQRVNSAQQQEGEGEDLLWLMTRRPESGLLAGQWEFPSALLWTSVNSRNETNSLSSSSDTSLSPQNKKRPDMSDQVPRIAAVKRARALAALLDDISWRADDSLPLLKLSQTKRSTIHHDDSPLEHVFSHVRHTMYVEHGHCQITCDSHDHAFMTGSSLQWKDRQGREVRWMTQADMGQVGVTSGVKKILKAVTASSHFGKKRRKR